MIKHIVIWQLQNNAKKIENARKIKQMLESLLGKIDGLSKIEVGLSMLADKATLGDICLYSEFTNQQALEAYQLHPLHVAAKEFIQQHVAARSVVDFVANSPL